MKLASLVWIWQKTYFRSTARDQTGRLSYAKSSTVADCWNFSPACQSVWSRWRPAPVLITGDARSVNSVTMSV